MLGKCRDGFEDNNVKAESSSTKVKTETREEVVAANVDSSVKKLDNKDLTFENDDAVVRFNQFDSSISKVVLKKFDNEYHSDKKVELLSKPLKIQALTSYQAETFSNYSAKRSNGSLELSKLNDGIEYSQKFIPSSSGYGMELIVSFKTLVQ